MSDYIQNPKYSCALGAQQTVIAIPKGVPIVHAGPGCSVKISGFFDRGQGYAGGNTVPCTNASSEDVVFGGSNKLEKLIESTFKILDGDIYVVLTGCTSDVIGDDIASVVKDFQEDGKPVVYVETGGFKSNNYVSHSRVVNAVIDQYVDRFYEKREKTAGLVNVFASIPDQDPYWEGNLEELKRILEGIGLNVNILFGAKSKGVEEWKTIPDAEFNLVVSSWAGLEIAEHLEKKYGTPYLHFPYFPIGGQQTVSFLNQITAFTGIGRERADRFIQEEEDRFYAYLEKMADFILEFKYGLPRKYYIVLDASYAVGLSKFLLNELGILPGKIYITDGTPEQYRDGIEEEFRNISEYRQAAVEFETDGGRIIEEIRADERRSRTIVLGTAWESPLAKEINADFLIVGVPLTYKLVLNSAYVGFNGGLHIMEEIYNGVLHTYRA